MKKAQDRGEGFVPGCGDVAAIILNPIDDEGETNAQVTLIPYPVQCKAGQGAETAWASGDTKFVRGWGSYFIYTISQ